MSLEDIGTQASELIIKFLKSNDIHGYKFTVYTFTELFAFVYFEIDHVIFGRKISTRDLISESLSKSYWLLLLQNEVADEEKHHTMLNKRIGEYASMFRLHKEKSDMVEKLDFYLNQASGLNDYHTEESPICIGDAFVNVINSAALTSFYIDNLAPLVERTIAKNQ